MIPRCSDRVDDLPVMRPRRLGRDAQGEVRRSSGPRSSRARPWGVAALALLVAVGLGGCAPRPATTPLELWVYCSANLAEDGEVDQLEEVWRRAAAAGYARVVLDDAKFSRLGEMDERYFANVARLRRLARELSLDVMPSVFPVGRSNALLALAPELAEGLPVRDALFEVRGGRATLVPDPPVRFGARPDLADPGVVLAGDSARVSARGGRHARFMFRVRVAPWRCYHVSATLAASALDGDARVEILGGGRPLRFARGFRATEVPARVDLVFHSLANREVAVYFGVWSGRAGEARWSDWRIEEAGPFDVLRRAGTRFTARGLVEGRDFDPVIDPRLGTTPWRGQYAEWLPPLAVATRLPEGTRFRASWDQAAVVADHSTLCLSEPGTDRLLADMARRVRAAWGASSYMMMHDEIRVMNQDATCARRRSTPGRILADNARRCVSWLPHGGAWVWSDMFDPRHDARPDYALVNGDLAGSWEGLPSDVGIVNWNAGRASASLRFFAARGHPQVIAGYYDGRVEDVRGWLAAARGVPGVRGIMYTTWRSDSSDLEAFARAVRNARR